MIERDDNEWVCEVTFPDGVHRHRRLIDVLAHDGIHADGEYITVRARRPRPNWPDDLVAAVRTIAHEFYGDNGTRRAA